MSQVTRKIKILYIIDKMKPAGAQTHLAEVISGLDKALFEPRLITLEEIGVKRIYGLSGFRGLLKLVRLMKKEKYDVVQTYLFSENILGVIAAKFAGVKVIITGRRDTGLLCQGGWQHILAYRLTNRWVNKIICVSEAVRRVVLEKEKVDSKKVAVIYNGVNLERSQSHKVTRSQVKASLGIEADDLIVGMVANFSWIKGHEVLLKAALEIIKEVPNVKFVLIGDGELKESLKSQVSSLKLEDKILFLGKRKDIPELLSIMDVSLNLSYSEGMSNTILESMAAGVPVVATAVDGNLETVIDGETGALIPVGDPVAAGLAIIKLLKDENLRRSLGAKAKRIAQEKFDSKIMIRKMENLYKDLLSRPSSIVHRPSSKIAFIFSQFPAYDETFILREMNELRKTGLSFEIYSLKIPKDKIMHEEAKDLAKTTSYLPFFSLKLLGCDLFYLFRYPLRYFPAFFQALWFNLKSPNFFLKTCAIWYKAVGFAFKARQDGITHVHGQWATFPATVAFIISKLNNIPFSFTGHAHDIYLDTTMLAFKIKRAKFVTTCTEHNKHYLVGLVVSPRSIVNSLWKKRKDKLKKETEDKIIVNYHGVDLKKFARPSSIVHRPSSLRILSVGSLLECKGFEYLIEACRILKDEDIYFKCTIAGGGKLEQSLKSQVSSHKLEDKVKFTGYIKQDQLIPLYKEADVFVLAMVPEIHWGIPNVLLEAAASSVPVICTMLPSIPELVKDGETGFIIPAKDPMVIALAIKKLYCEQELRKKIGEAGRKVVEQKFDVAANALKLKRLFEIAK